MAEDRDESQQTEQPTPRRLEEARRKGQVASSREAATFLMLGVTVLGWMALVPPLSAQVTAWLAVLLQRAGTLRVDEPGAGEVLLNGLGITAAALALPMAAYLTAPVIAAALQNAFVWSTESLGFKAERISPLSGLRRLASAKALLETAKGLVKLGLVGVAVVMSCGPTAPPSSPQASCRSKRSSCCSATSSSAFWPRRRPPSGCSRSSTMRWPSGR
jgi:flagellar biosynthetic protein FlhB